MYFDSNLNITSLYRDYFVKYCEERNIQPVSEDKFRRIFSESYNIGFKLPKSDTCKTCDTLEITINESKTEEEKRQASITKDLHLKRAKAMRGKLREMSAKAKEKPDDIHVISIDLQQTLPTPKLSCGPAFYLRKLWTYNVGVHDCAAGIGHMITWDETVAGRESDEIGSCIVKYVKSRGLKRKKLVVFLTIAGVKQKIIT